MSWVRVAVFGVVLWLVPFALSLVLFAVREANRALFESLITVIGVACAVAASLLFFRKVRSAGVMQGLAVGVAWAAISVVIDLPIFLAGFGMSPSDYAADVALTYLAFPLITIGIAAAMQPTQS